MKHDCRLLSIISLSFAFATIKREGLIGVSLVGWRNSLVTLIFSTGEDCHYPLIA